MWEPCRRYADSRGRLGAEYRREGVSDGDVCAVMPKGWVLDAGPCTVDGPITAGGLSLASGSRVQVIGHLRCWPRQGEDRREPRDSEDSCRAVLSRIGIGLGKLPEGVVMSV